MVIYYSTSNLQVNCNKVKLGIFLNKLFMV